MSSEARRRPWFRELGAICASAWEASVCACVRAVSRGGHRLILLGVAIEGAVPVGWREIVDLTLFTMRRICRDL